MRNEEQALIAILVVVYGFIFLLTFAMMIFITICRYKILEKAGHKGWYAFVPIYGAYIMITKVAGKDDTMFILHFLPFINIYAIIMTNMALAKSFGKDDGFGIGLSFLAAIFAGILAFNKSIVYLGPGGINNNFPSSNPDNLTNNWQKNNPNVPPIV